MPGASPDRKGHPELFQLLDDQESSVCLDLLLITLEVQPRFFTGWSAEPLYIF